MELLSKRHEPSNKHPAAKNPNLPLRTMKRAPKVGRSYTTRGKTSLEPIIIKPIPPKVEDEAAAEVVE